MILDIYKKEIDELNRTSVVQQTAFWSMVKSKAGFDSIALNFKTRRSNLLKGIVNDSAIVSDILIIIQQLNSSESVAYVPYGPELEPDNEFQGVFLEELSESLRSFLPKSCFMIRYDLCWENLWKNSGCLAESSGQNESGIGQMNEPSIYSQEIRFNFNTNNWNLRKSETDILPTNTLYIDLRYSLDSILARMRPKTRYNIRLSERNGVTVRIADLNDLNIWYSLYRETALRNGLYLTDIKYFEAVLTTRADSTKSPADVYYLIAEKDGVPLAAMFLIISGNRGTYLYGASSSMNRNLMAPYALQWSAVKISKEKGCKEYDMFGVSSKNDVTHPLYGLYKFKSGFGGEIFHTSGCWDYPFNKDRYNIFKSFRLIDQGYHN